MKRQEHQEELEQQEASPADSNESAWQEVGDAAAGASETEAVAADAVEEDPVQRLEREKAELEAKNKELHNQYLMARADLDNYRKRMVKEKQEAFDYANENLLSDLLESLDNFDRALDAASTATDVAGSLIERGTLPSAARCTM